MLELVKRVFFVSLSLRGPDSLPWSRAMLMLFLVPWAVLSLAGNLLVLSRYPDPALLSILGLALEFTLMASYSGLTLHLAGKLERWPQTLISLLGVQTVVMAAAFPLVWLSAGSDEPSAALQTAEYGFTAWWLVAMANILSRAMDRSLLRGVLLALGHFVLSLAQYALLINALGGES